MVKDFPNNDLLLKYLNQPRLDQAKAKNLTDFCLKFGRTLVPWALSVTGRKHVVKELESVSRGGYGT